MSSLPRSRTPDLSRSKIYLSHLGELLYERTLQPETAIASKLFPKSRVEALKKRSKSSNLLQLFKKGAEKTQKEAALLDYRSQKLPQTSGNHRPRPSLINLRPKSTIFGEPGPSLQGTAFTFQFSRPAFHHFSSVQIPLKQPIATPHPQQQKPFLRKGSNLQRQIVASLLRNSSSRRDNLESRRYSKSEITKMVQVFKGTNETTKESKGVNGKGVVRGKQVVMSYSSVQRGRQPNLREIAGWQQQSMELVAVQP